MHLPAAQMDEKEHIIGHQSTERPDFGREEVSRDENIHVRADELRPRAGRLAFGSRRYAMAFEDVANRLVTDGVPEVGQSADDPVIAPGTILLGQADNQRLQLRVDHGATRSLPLLRAIKLLGHELPMPGKNRVWLNDRGYFLEGLLAQLLANGGQGRAFAIRQPHTAC